jgi:hypothetical protein
VKPLVHSIAAATLLVATCTVSPALAAHTPDGRGGNLRNPAVLPPASSPYGHSYSEWSALWWQWAYSLPVTNHPLFDETGAFVGTGQSGPVWYLGGVFNVSGTATRNVTIPAGTALFFPIINVEWDNICPPSDPPLSLAELQAFARQAMDGATNLACELDGVSIQNLSSYRFTSVFPVTFPTDNIFDAFGCPTPPGTYGPLANDGFYLMLRPLSSGQHTLHFHGFLPAFGFALDITYNLTVTPGSGTVLESERTPASVTGRDAQAPTGKRRTWGALKVLYR